MFAVVDILGQQFKVSENTKYFVPRLQDESQKAVTFKSVLLFSNGDVTKVGNPYVEGVSVEAKILEHVKDDKVLVFKKKIRTGYDKKNGHRQALTKIEITKIDVKE